MYGALSIWTLTPRQLAHQYPRDVMALKRGQLLAFLLGDAKRMLELVQLPEVIKACSALPYFQGMLGFALEQNLHLQVAIDRKSCPVRMLRDICHAGSRGSGPEGDSYTAR